MAKRGKASGAGEALVPPAPEPFDIIEGAQPPLRPLHLVVRETEFCGQRLAGDFSRRMRENGPNSVRRPRTRLTNRLFRA